MDVEPQRSSPTSAEGQTVRLVVEFDGLLERFGRVVPDAVAMLAAVQRLRRYLKTLPRAPRFAVGVVRFADSASEEDALQALSSELSRLEPWSAIGSLAASASVASSPDDVSTTAAESDRIILLTASHHHFQQAISAGVEAYHIGHSTPPEHRGLPFDDVPRRLEEVFRIPTARPMAHGLRTGGLVAIHTAGPADARARALDAVLEDPAADWVTIGSQLILYTEQTDLEDRLSQAPGGKHLSYAVHKDALVLAPVGAAAGEEALYEGSGFAIRESADASSIGHQHGSDPPFGWASIRRRTFQTGDPLTRSSTTSIFSAERYLAARQRFAPLLSNGLDRRSGSLAECLLAIVRRIVGPSAAADLLLHQLKPAAVTWTTPYRGADPDDLIALVHDATPPAGGEYEAALAAEAADALALADNLSSAPPTIGVLHCLRLTPDVSIDELLEASLHPEEHNRLLAAVHLEGLRGIESQACTLRITADPRLDQCLEQLRSTDEGVAWFSRAGVGPPRVDVRVVASPGTPSGVLDRLLALVTSIIS